MKYPIYIVSKGRADSQKTVKLLEANGIKNYFVIVEQAEKEAYIKSVGAAHVITIKEGNGSSATARNLAITHSMGRKFKKHWQFDDDITSVREHLKAKTVSNNVIEILTKVEQLSDSYPMVSIAGLHFANFLSGVTKSVTENTMVSGLTLITNTAIRFRGTMYVDRDFVLQSLKRGYSTIKCNDYFFTYTPTLVQKGGYYDTYNDDAKRLASIKEFLSYHPEIDPTIERHPLGFLHLKNIAGIWRKYQTKTKTK